MPAIDPKAPVLALLGRYEVTDLQRQVIMEAATKPPDYQEWFVDQFTRNR